MEKMLTRRGADTVYRNGSMELFTKENGKTTKQKEEVLSGMLRVTFMLVTSKLTKPTVLVYTLMSMAQGMKDSG